MAKFCTRCGRKLDKDEKCTCEKIKKEKERVIEENKTDLFSKIGSFIKNPIEALSNLEFLQGNDYLMLLLASLSFGFINCLMPFGRSFRNFISTSVLTFIFFIIFAFMLSFIKNTIYKKENKYEDILKIVAISSIVLLCGNIMAIFFSFISLLGLFIMIGFSFILFILYCYHGLLLLKDGNQNSIAYELVLSLILSLITMFLFLVIL